MKIQPTMQYSNGTNFRSAYPVVHWVAETNGSYAPAVTLDLTKKLQRKLVTLLNSSESKFPKNKSEFFKNLQIFMAKWDKDYKTNPYARSFYIKKGGWNEGKFSPLAYMITGDDADAFERIYAKPLGGLKNQSLKNGCGVNSAELNIALRDYYVKGLNFVKTRALKYSDKDGMCYGMHTKFEIIRNKKGEIKDFEFKGLAFCPESGEKNPFVRLGFVKQ